MTVSAPSRPPRWSDPATREPRPPRPGDSVEREDPEALIEEARQRQRRRRRLYGAAAALAAALVALAGIAAFGVFDGGAQSSSASSGPAGWPGPPGEESTLVAHFSEFHFGWVLLYADGRLILYKDVSAYGPETGAWHTALEQRLSPAGVELVRAGEVELSDFLRSAERSLPAHAWADRVAKPYVPTRYAVLYWGRPDTGPVTPLLDATRVVGRLPEPLQALLRGKERTYPTWDIFLRSPTYYPSALENSELTAEEASALRKALTPFAIGDGTNTVPLSEAVGETRAVWIELSPIFPHGEWALWGG